MRGVPAPNNSLVDVDDVLHTVTDVEPSNSANHYEAVLCVTDLVDCCQSPRLGNWYFPDGRTAQDVRRSITTF